jgi:hypothetical protein
VAMGLSHRLSAADGRGGRPRADVNCASFKKRFAALESGRSDVWSG